MIGRVYDSEGNVQMSLTYGEEVRFFPCDATSASDYIAIRIRAGRICVHSSLGGLVILPEVSNSVVMGRQRLDE